MNNNTKLRILHIFFPNKCPSCHKIILPEKLFCKKCENEFIKLNGERCKVCFNRKERCDCKKYPKFFKRSFSAFIYDKSAKNALITLKHYNNKRLFNYFADSIVKILNENLNEINPDAVISVPMHKSKLKKRGYNQSDILAQNVADKLNVPKLNNVLIQKDPAVSQHTLGYKQRIENVKGIYRAGGLPIEYQNIILIDDIMTSGATLNECAKMLRLEGASNIYCATAAKSE